MTSTHTAPVSVAELQDVPATALIPLWYRAQESARLDAIVRDPHAERIVRAVAFDFAPLASSRAGWLTQLGVSNRTVLFDAAVGDFLAIHPTGAVVNVGCGLDARFLRLDDRRVRWIDVDLPETIALRRRFFAEFDPRYRMVAGSLLDDGWLATLTELAGTPILVLCEGTLMYFSEAQVRTLLTRLIERLPVRAFCLEIAGPLMLRGIHPTLRALGLTRRFAWGTSDFAAIAAWNPRLALERVDTIWDLNRNRIGTLRLVGAALPWLKTAIGSSVVRLRVRDDER